jgi:hypothetical protein
MEKREKLIIEDALTIFIRREKKAGEGGMKKNSH